MTFAAQETSQDNGQPIELYTFVREGLPFRFTNATTDQTFGGNTYLAIKGLDRTQPVRKLEETGLQMRVTMSIHDQNSQTFARGWLVQPPETPTTIEVFQVHTTDTANELHGFFKGSVKSPKYDNSTVTLLCSSLDVIFDTQGPRASYASGCSHAHYDALCTVIAASFTYVVTVTVVDADGVTFTMAGLDSLVQVGLVQGRFGDGAFQVRQIVETPGVDQVRIKYPMSDPPEVGDSVTIVEGCLHDLPACKLYANSINYGGIPWSIKINPFTHSRGLESQT